MIILRFPVKIHRPYIYRPALDHTNPFNTEILWNIHTVSIQTVKIDVIMLYVLKLSNYNIVKRVLQRVVLKLNLSPPPNIQPRRRSP